MPDNPIGDAQAIKAAREQKERDRKEYEARIRAAQLIEIEQEEKLLDLGFERVLIIEYQPNGIFPNARFQPVTPERSKELREFYARYRKDVETMSAEDAPKSGIIGADGAPVESPAK